MSLVGRRFGCLVVLSEPRPSGDGKGGRGMVALCRCDCGVEKDIRLSRLTQTQSCGCAFRRSRGRRAAVDISGGVFCAQCYDLPHRRPQRSLCRCGERYQAQPPLTALECAELVPHESPISWCAEP